jgi:hypothetical protein
MSPDPQTSQTPRQLEPPLMSVLYCSRAAAGMGPREIQAMVDKARAANADLGITGLLIYGSGVFFQWLEGPSEQVRALMARIRQDGRHSQVVEVAFHDTLPERLFPAWGMELVSPAALREVIADAITAADGGPKEAPLRALLARVEVARLAGLD